MSGSEHTSELIILSPLGRTWPSCIWAILLHGGIACLFLWQQQNGSLSKIEIGYPVEIVRLEEKPELPEPFSAQKEKMSKKTGVDRPKPVASVQEKDAGTEGAAMLPSATEAKTSLSLKSGNPHPPYPEYARENAIEGKVVAILKIETSTGIVQEVKITEPKAHVCLEESVIETVRNWRFQSFGSHGCIEEIFPFEFRLTEDN